MITITFDWIWILCFVVGFIVGYKVAMEVEG